MCFLFNLFCPLVEDCPEKNRLNLIFKKKTSCAEGFGSLRLVLKYYSQMTLVTHHFLERGLFVLFLFGL